MGEVPSLLNYQDRQAINTHPSVPSIRHAPIQDPGDVRPDRWFIDPSDIQPGRIDDSYGPQTLWPLFDEMGFYDRGTIGDQYLDLGQMELGSVPSALARYVRERDLHPIGQPNIDKDGNLQGFTAIPSSSGNYADIHHIGPQMHDVRFRGFPVSVVNSPLNVVFVQRGFHDEIHRFDWTPDYRKLHPDIRNALALEHYIADFGKFVEPHLRRRKFARYPIERREKWGMNQFLINLMKQGKLVWNDKWDDFLRMYVTVNTIHGDDKLNGFLKDSTYGHALTLYGGFSSSPDPVTRRLFYQLIDYREAVLAGMNPYSD